jgi:hypothetical protein
MTAEPLNQSSEFRRCSVLDQADAIVGSNPVSQALMPNGIVIDFCVGRQQPNIEGAEPVQVILARIPANEAAGQARVITVAHRKLSDPWPHLTHIEQSQSADVITGQPLAGDAVDGVGEILAQTDFSVGDGAPVRELQNRLTTPGRYGRWVEVMLDPLPLVDIV